MPTHKQQATTALAHTRVVLIEHRDTLRDVLRDSLNARGMGTVAAFADLDSFRRQPVELPPDVLLLDLDLPGTDGLSLCREFRAINPQLVLIAMGAEMRSDQRAASLEAGADHTFTKPVSVTELVAGIRRVLVRRTGPTPDPLSKTLH